MTDSTQSMGLPSADWLATVVTVGPPVLLVLGLVIVLYAAANAKITILSAVVLSGIAAFFFGLWILALPLLQVRRIYITSVEDPDVLRSEYSLQPVRYQIGQSMRDLSDGDLEMPNGHDPVPIKFDLKSLIASYEDNMTTVVNIAEYDRECFDQAAKGVSYWKVVANIKKICPGSVLSTKAQP
jgi:hypothetical protein